MKRLRVLMIPSGYPTETAPTDSIFFKDHAQAIARYNDVSVLFAYPFPKSLLSKGKLFQVRISMESGVNVIRVEHIKFFKKLDILVSFFLTILAFSRFQRIKEIHIIHAQKFFPAGILAVALGSTYKMPVVITEHSSDFPHTMRSVIRRISIRFAMRKATRIVAVSEGLSNSIKCYDHRLNTRIIPNPVNVDRFSSDNSKPGKHPTKRILHVSSLNHLKAIPNLIEAVVKLRSKRSDFVIDIVGGSPNDVEKYRKRVEANKVSRIIRFHGKKSRTDIANFMRNCDFFVLPSLKESFGVVLIEAMACGKPVIATYCGGPEEIVTQRTGILIPPANTEALIDAINYMLDNYHKYDPLHISKYARDNFSYERVGKTIDELYAKCLK